MPTTICLPDFDLPTRNATGFLIRWILPRMEPVHLYAFLDRKGPFSLSLPQSDILIAVGHGSESEITGQNETLLMDTSSIPDVKGTIIVLISCATATKLGPALVSAGALSYIGFREDLLWVADADLASMPWNDKMAEPVMMPIVDSLNSILDGKSTGEAFQRLTSSFNSRLASEEDELTASLIAWNRDSAVLLGDPDARVRARPKIVFPFPPPPLPPGNILGLIAGLLLLSPLPP